MGSATRLAWVVAVVLPSGACTRPSAPAGSVSNAGPDASPTSAPAQPSSPQPLPAAAHVLIWGGGQTRAEAEDALKGWVRGVDPDSLNVHLDENFPQIIESASLTGLKPGF